MKFALILGILFFSQWSIASSVLQCNLNVRRFQNNKVVYADNQIVNASLKRGVDNFIGANVTILSSDKSVRLEGSTKHFGTYSYIKVTIIDEITKEILTEASGTLHSGLSGFHQIPGPDGERIRFKCTNL